MRHHEQGYDKTLVPEVLQFTTRQPDGHEVFVDMSTPGGFGDFAFEARDDRGVTQFLAYWTEERAIFIDIMKRLMQQPQAEFTQSIERIQSLLNELTNAGYTPTTEGEGTMPATEVRWLLSRTTNEPQRYQRYSEGDDSLIVDISQADGIHFVSERGIDARRGRKEITIPNTDIWRFAAGMIARSYIEDGGYISLTRFATTQYDVALETCLNDLASSEHLAE